MTTIDLNSDLGENSPARQVSDDAAMLDLVSSANISCGFHAGTPEGIKATVAAAAHRSVVIGAHPSYQDHDGFGRRDLAVEPAELQAQLEYQIGALIGVAAAVGADVRYVKPHGALYNAIAVDEATAAVVVSAVRAIDPHLVMLGLSGGVILQVAERAGLTTAAEAFADRAYLRDGRLLPRSLPGAVLDDPQLVADRMLHLCESGRIAAVDGSLIAVAADSICVHGDSPAAVNLATSVRRRLQASGVEIAPFITN